MKNFHNFLNITMFEAHSENCDYGKSTPYHPLVWRGPNSFLWKVQLPSGICPGSPSFSAAGTLRLNPTSSSRLTTLCTTAKRFLPCQLQRGKNPWKFFEGPGLGHIPSPESII